MQGCDNGGVTSGETGEGLQIKGYLASAKFSNWTMSDCSNRESAGGEFVGRAWVEGYTNFVGDDGGKDVFVHISAVERAGLKGLNENQKVGFELQSGRDGKQSAGDLRLL